MRRYDEPIAVRAGEVDGRPAPVEFLWRRRLWRVLGVEARWRETADWWSLSSSRSERDEGWSLSSSRSERDEGLSLSSSRSERDDLLAETEVYRVLASPGRSSSPGVYELAHPVSGEEWVLRAVVD